MWSCQVAFGRHKLHRVVAASFDAVEMMVWHVIRSVVVDHWTELNEKKGMLAEPEVKPLKAAMSSENDMSRLTPRR